MAHFITRKHQILLWQSLIWPILCLLLPVIFLILFLLNPGPLYLWLAAISFLVSLVAIYLKWLDWGNDYYIVTNRRVYSTWRRSSCSMTAAIPVFWLARFDLFLPLRVLVILSTLLHCGTGILLFNLLRKFLSAPVAAAAAGLWMFQLLIHTTLVKGGLETALSVFLLVWLLLAVVTRRGERPGLASLLGLGVLAGLSILARLDNIFLVALLGVWYVLGFATTSLRNLVVGDLAWICAAGFLSYFLRLGAGGSMPRIPGPCRSWSAWDILSIPISLFLFGMYSPGMARPAWQTLARTVLAVSAAAAATGLILLLLQKAGLLVSLPRSVIVINWGLLLPGLVLLRLVCAWGSGLSRPRWMKNSDLPSGNNS